MPNSSANATNHVVARRWAQSLVFLLIVLTACAGQPAATSLVSQRSPDMAWPVLLPPGFQIGLYARDLGEVRSVAVSPDGTPYVTVMRRSLRNGGRVLALPDANHDGQADRVVAVAEGLDRPHGLLFYQGQLYVSDTAGVYRLNDTNGDLVADSRDTLVDNLATKGDHWSRPFVFDRAGNLLVAVGSSCNNCQEGDKRRATILRYPAASLGQPGATPTIYARGLRSVVGLTWRPGSDELWATNNGPDHLGPTLPPDQLFQIHEGQHYGWPYCYGDRTPDPQALADSEIVTPDRSPKDAFCQAAVTAPERLLPAHSAPLNLAFYDGTSFPETMHGSLFIALHGAYDYSNLDGYKVVRIPFVNGKPQQPQDFLAGLARAGDRKWLGRPVGLAVAQDGSLLVSDDANGAIYRITYQ